MNLPQFLKQIDETTSKMTKEELAARIHAVARTLPEERREWLLSMLSGNDNENAAPEKTAPEDLYEQLEKINNGAYRLDSEYNEAWDEWYAPDEPDFLFQDKDELLPIIEEAYEELHRLVDCAAYREACRLGQVLLNVKVQTDGDYSDDEDDPLELDDLEYYNLISFSFQDMLLDIACAIYFTYSGQERAAALYQTGARSHFGAEWELEELMQRAPTELPDFDAFLQEWILYLQTKDEAAAKDYLDEALKLQADSASALETARQSVTLHPELYLRALTMQKDDNARLEIGLEALHNIESNKTVRSEIALETAEAALRLGDGKCAENCRIEAFRSDSTVVNFLRALVNHSDYTSCLVELNAIASEFNEQPIRNLDNNYIGKNIVRLIRFLNGEFQDAYADLFGKYDSYTPALLHQGIALIALFLYPGIELREGSEAMLRILETELPFNNDKYLRGLNANVKQADADILWECLQKCRSQTPLPNCENALHILQTHCTEFTDYVMTLNMRYDYAACAAYAAVIAEILEAEGKTPSKNTYMLERKQAYPRRTAYHRELRAYGMVDGK